MVRHEAGEALGAIGSGECMQLVRDHAGDTCQEASASACLPAPAVQGPWVRAARETTTGS